MRADFSKQGRAPRVVIWPVFTLNDNALSSVQRSMAVHARIIAPVFDGFVPPLGRRDLGVDFRLLFVAMGFEIRRLLVGRHALRRASMVRALDFDGGNDCIDASVATHTNVLLF
jgi:hypothetical protein